MPSDAAVYSIHNELRLYPHRLETFIIVGLFLFFDIIIDRFLFFFFGFMVWIEIVVLV